MVGRKKERVNGNRMIEAVLDQSEFFGSAVMPLPTVTIVVVLIDRRGDESLRQKHVQIRSVDVGQNNTAGVSEVSAEFFLRLVSQRPPIAIAYWSASQAWDRFRCGLKPDCEG